MAESGGKQPGRVSRFWRAFRRRATSSPKMLILHWFVGGTFFMAFVMSINYWNIPLSFEELEVYEGVLVSAAGAGRGRRNSCGDKLVIRTAEGETLSFRSRLHPDVIEGLRRGLRSGEEEQQVKLWVQSPWYNFFCFHVVARAHQIYIDDEAVTTLYDEERYARRMRSHRQLIWWFGIPLGLGVLGLFGIWRIARRDRRAVSTLNETQGE